MRVGSLTIQTELFDVVDKLQKQLEGKNIDLISKFYDSGDDVMLCCPYHKNGQECRPSAGIRKSDGLFHCLACGETHSLPDVISHCFGETDRMWGYKWLLSNIVCNEVSERGDIILDCSRTIDVDVPVSSASSYISEEELDTYRYTHPYLYRRGLTDEVIEQFDIGYDKATDSITFPVKDLHGNCLFVARRKVQYKQFDIPKGMEKPLYGIYEVMEQTKPQELLDKVYVCEGLFDCLRLWCVGKVAVAGFGCLFSDYQIKLLNKLPTRNLVLALDNDDAGKKATARIKSLIKTKLLTEVQLPAGRKDIGECTDEELTNLQEEL